MTSEPRHWLSEAILYEIYPQSFADSNGDGIGDLEGVRRHLDHLAWLGVNTIWFNPCFDSPFLDAGYDVADYQLIAPRYGTNEDLIRLVTEAGERGIRVLLDLVAGHTSTEHAWFRAACLDDTDQRYIWSDTPGPRFVPSPGPRPGYYLKNFFDSQPALNFGYASLDPAQPWRQPTDAPGPLANRQALRDIMAFWLDRGVAGFRVDMAFSLVKDDPGYVATVALWQDLRAWLDETYPQAILIPEGVEPLTTGSPAFHADFFLVIHEPHSSLFNNSGAGTLPWTDNGPCYFDAAGQGSVDTLLSMWAEHDETMGHDRLPLLASADHDFSRLACGPRTGEQLGAAFTFLLTWACVPSIYFGDEIGVRYQPGLPDVEGSIAHPSYNRAGARTPMQWDDSANAGFSDTSGPLYLPIDPDPHRPTVAAQLADENSTLHLVRRLVALRREIADLGPTTATSVLHKGYPFVYRRGERHVVVLNPGASAADAAVPELAGATALEASGIGITGPQVTAGPFSYGIYRLAD